MKPPYPPMRDLWPLLREDVGFLIWAPVFLIATQLIQLSRYMSPRVDEAFIEQVRKVYKTQCVPQEGDDDAAIETV